MKIKKGDSVKILAGKDRGKSGKVLRVMSDTGRIAVEGVNTVSKRMRPTKAGQKGQVVVVARPLPIPRVAVICPSCKAATRIGYKVNGSSKVRICRKCQAQI